MNYSKSIKRADIARRVILSWCVVAVVFLLIGGVSGYALKTHITAKQGGQDEKQTNIQAEGKTLVYGAYDDRTFTQEIPLDWDAGDLDFVPLQCSMPQEEQEFLFYLCSGYNIDFCLVMAMIQTESKFDASAVSATDDYGLMQINQNNHDWLTETLGVTDYLDPYQNMRAGCYILRKLFERYQDTELVLMCYNMGENGASRLWENGIYHTDYTEQVLNCQRQYQEQLEGD
ncbi:MAG: transglycosylase SLT domain-containing protein [bacterium]|nr:transglycosylase SLT domain-containing protein [bacterium]MCM1373580.1 transglycosylase SLT domain-containing protein [Muribaculum sp.]